MQAARDSDWLAGEGRWYPASESVPESLADEANPPESWSVTDHRDGGRGWIRQRLQPLGPMILYTTAWAPFFLLASLVPLVFPGNTPELGKANSVPAAGRTGAGMVNQFRVCGLAFDGRQLAAGDLPAEPGD